MVPHTSSASAEAASTSTPQAVAPLYVGKKAVVVGAGPAGSATAMFLARQGFSVDVSTACNPVQPLWHEQHVVAPQLLHKPCKRVTCPAGLKLLLIHASNASLR